MIAIGYDDRRHCLFHLGCLFLSLLIFPLQLSRLKCTLCPTGHQLQESKEVRESQYNGVEVNHKINAASCLLLYKLEQSI